MANVMRYPFLNFYNFHCHEHFIFLIENKNYKVPPIMLHVMVMLMNTLIQKRKKYTKICVLYKDRVEVRYYFKFKFIFLLFIESIKY